jgi:hypothetical protein
MTLRHFLALEMATLLAWNSASARPAVWGVVVEANHVHLNTGTVSAGATVYDGDHFSTEPGGMLLLRGDAALLELTGESAAIVRSQTNGAQGTEAELGKGTLVFSAARASAVEIVAWEGRIRPIADVRTVAQVSVAGPKELRIYAQRGSLQFLYRGETETIAEGDSYQVILDPPEDDPKNKPVKAGRHRKPFLLIAIGAAAAGTTVILYEHMNHGHKRMESPDRP